MENWYAACCWQWIYEYLIQPNVFIFQENQIYLRYIEGIETPKVSQTILSEDNKICIDIIWYIWITQHAKHTNVTVRLLQKNHKIDVSNLSIIRQCSCQLKFEQIWDLVQWYIIFLNVCPMEIKHTWTLQGLYSTKIMQLLVVIMCVVTFCVSIL